MKRLSLLLVTLFCSLCLFAQTEEIQKISEQEYSQDEYTALEMLGPHYLSSLEITLHELNWGLDNHENVALNEEIVKVSEVYVYSAEDFRLIHYHNGDVHEVDLDQIAQKADLLMNNEGIYYYVMRE